jgi:hypothetical protein
LHQPGQIGLDGLGVLFDSLGHGLGDVADDLQDLNQLALTVL